MHMNLKCIIILGEMRFGFNWVWVSTRESDHFLLMSKTVLRICDGRPIYTSISIIKKKSFPCLCGSRRGVHAVVII